MQTSQENYFTIIVSAKFGGLTECIMDNWKIENAALGRFPFDQKFRFEISGIPYEEWNGIFRFVQPTRPRPSRSKFRAKIQTAKQGKMC